MNKHMPEPYDAPHVAAAHRDAAYTIERHTLPQNARRVAAAHAHMRAGNVVASFRYAFAGVFYLITTQRNAQIHCAIGLAALVAGAVLGISRVEWAVIVATCAMVLAAEGANTAIEAVVDIASPEYHPLAKIAKDVAAGAVLLCAIAAAINGLIIFGPRLWALVIGLL